MMTEKHVLHLVNKYNIKLGIQIKFENFLKTWQQSGTILKDSMLEQAGLNDVETLNKTETLFSTSKEMKLDIHKIIVNSSQGRTVLNMYKQSSTLNASARTIIVDLIINYMIQNDARMTVLNAQEISTDIIRLFPCENLVRFCKFFNCFLLFRFLFISGILFFKAARKETSRQDIR